MAQAIGKYAAKKMLNSQMKKYKHKESVGNYVCSPSSHVYHPSSLTSQNLEFLRAASALTNSISCPQDPYYENRRDPRTGRMKKFKKQIPSYIPEHDAEILAACRKRAYHLDCALFTLLGVRFGWSSVIGLIPEIGDIIDGYMAVRLWRKCAKVDGGLPMQTHLIMLAIIIADVFVGLVPILGDFLDGMFKCNTLNVRLLERHLDKKYKPKELARREEDEARRSDNPPPAPATEYEDMSGEDELPQYSTRPPSPGPHPRRPEPARVAAETRGGPRPDGKASRSGSFFGFGGSKSKRDQPVDSGMGATSSRTHGGNGNRF